MSSPSTTSARPTEMTTVFRWFAAGEKHVPRASRSRWAKMPASHWSTAGSRTPKQPGLNFATRSISRTTAVNAA